ncbi:hypothetical protein [Halorussus pelagicus]|uniref:hypothetical protein n=1 Tax=Halorussus pelagicus TaxID=2505977 RepID=UPI000FFCBF12|nr:hypothetical protein [Halorussus pelagicus]
MTRKRLSAALVTLLVVAALGTTGTASATPEIGSETDETCGESVTGVASSPSKQGVPILQLSIAPQERQVVRGESELFVICIANPAQHDQAMRNVIVYIEHDGSEEDNMSAIGPSLLIPTDNRIGMKPLDSSWDGGKRWGHGFALEEIEPGEVVQYTVVVSDVPETGKREIITEVDYDFSIAGNTSNHTVSEIAQLRVECPPSCALDAGIVAGEEFLRKYLELILLVLGTLFTILGVIIALVGPRKVREMVRTRIGTSPKRQEERDQRESQEGVE